MMLLRLSLLLSLSIPVVAEASLCNLEPVTLDIPANCPLVMYKRVGATVPAIELLRGEQRIEVQPIVRATRYVQLEVTYSDQCGDERVSETRMEAYDLVELELPGAQVGDGVWVSGQGQHGAIIADGQCRAMPEYNPWCNDSGFVDCQAGADPGGCSAGGASNSAALAFGLISSASLWWRRRCSSRRRA